ncbi:uncharacterized protein LOC129939950 [Eupeodes corollae]|uniref:uncharacterized protein LOC129939950 n=1 Tax=Eupeodes corollae TaxID=290404 RepID=UPI00249131DD|nr:uncharacterized protein LOC129939950 [Eupeodes corollae]
MRHQLDGDVEDFIAAVERRPLLYNFNLEEFHNTKLTRKLWNEIAAEFNTSVNYCKTKWAVLRVSFARQMRNEQTNAKRTNENLINDWYLKDNMFFMRKFMRRWKRRKSSEKDNKSCNYRSSRRAKQEINIPKSMLEIKNEPLFEDQNESSVSFVDDVPEIRLEEMVKVEADDEDVYEISLFSETSRKRTTTGDIGEDEQFLCINAKRRSIDPEANKAELLSSPQKNTKEDEKDLTSGMSLGSNQNDDATMSFFKSILPDFNSLNGRRQRLLKQKIMLELNVLLDEQENES